MAEINDQEIENAVREQVRPFAERLRNLVAEYQVFKTKKDLEGGWGSRLNSAQDGDTVAEGRSETEGVPDLTKAQIDQFLGVMETVAAQNSQIIAAPCVRPLQVNNPL